VNVNQKNLKTTASIVGAVLSGRTAFARIRQARSEDNRLEAVDAAIHMLAMVTGLLVIYRRLRENKEA
jgi:hypothetical protein